MRASIALIVWLGIALGIGYFLRDGITRTFGPDTWWMVAGWIGLIRFFWGLDLGAAAATRMISPVFAIGTLKICVRRNHYCVEC